ncbi:MAG TPA: chromosomal replication initiator protein DnaA [Spirochaetales bacterium]|nr:chromosomal replication initiator protein DnaA [Spirochaetales bacterium]HPB65754.1 chromosomal replication initiator protein DnaA [Spirochaetales bacterium]
MNSWDYQVFWNEAMSQFSNELSEQEFSMWFNIEYDSSTQDSILVRVPSAFYRDQLAKSYQKAIESKLFELSGKRLTIEFVVVKPDSSTSVPKPAPERRQETKPSKAQAEPEKPREKHPQLNLAHTFENYIIGENNSFAANAAMAIAANPGTAYNPFLIYGDVGLGKTHLMQAIGNRAWSLNPKLKIICVSAENFTNDFIHSIHEKAMSSFKNRYRTVDILLIDDIHFFENKEGSQEELFHTFNALYDGNKQMVFTCDRPASELKNLSDRLRSRFERGLNVDLQPPNYETRYAILKKKVETNNLNIPPEVFDVIARNISTNVRDLEAALVKLNAYADLVGKEITLEVAQQQLKDVFSQTRHGNVTIDHIIRTVSEAYKVSANDLKGKKRTRSIVVPRQIAMYIAREITEYSTTELGLEFGGRDHTTVMHSCQKIDEQLKLDPMLDAKIQKLIQAVRQMSVKS